MKTKAICAAALVAAAGALGPGVTARAQTADDYNRAAQAIRVCSSGAAAVIPECAQVRARFGLPSMSTQAALTGALGGAPAPAVPALPSPMLFGGGGGKAGAVAGLLGMAMNAAATSQAPAASTAPVPPANMSLGGLNPGALNGEGAGTRSPSAATGLLGAALGRR